MRVTCKLSHFGKAVFGGRQFQNRLWLEKGLTAFLAMCYATFRFAGD